MKTTENIYNQPPDHYDSTQTPDFIERFYSPIKQRVKGRLHPSETAVLDLCCGTGVMADMLYDLPNIRYTGIDINSGFLQRARRRIPDSTHFSFIKTDVLTFASRRKFDIILSVNAYHHVENRMKRRYIKKVRELLNPDAIAVVYETLISTYRNQEESAEANKDFYRKRIAWIKENESVSEKKLQAWESSCMLSMAGEDEYKVDYDTFIRDVSTSGLAMEEEIKIWPDTDLFASPKVGEFLFLLKKAP